MTSDDAHPDAIAIVGMAGRFPGAEDIGAFWARLAAGEELLTRFSPEELAARGVDEGLRDHPDYVPVRGTVANYDRFDAELFGIGAHEAALMDPQQRLLLETAWSALEHAGHDPERYKGRIGIYAGVGASSYLFNLLSQPGIAATVDAQQLAICTGKDHAALQLAYRLHLTGPAVAVQTAGSTSLVAVQMACIGLLGFQCDMALAGGAAVSVPAEAGYLHTSGSGLSPDGHCRAFEAGAEGTVPSDGVGLVVLKRLADAISDGDTIHAIILGAAVSNDGARKASYSAPSAAGQSDAIRAAQAMAGVNPGTITYVEANGAATLPGDSAEVEALTAAFRRGTQATGTCAIGSLKSAAGDMDAAAGVAGLIKTVLALKHRTLPPNVNYASPNPAIDFAATPFHVNTGALPWEPECGVRRAGVSSSGLGGTSAHVVLEEGPEPPPSPAPGRGWQALPLSARTVPALDTLESRVMDALAHAGRAEVADAAWTLQQGRKPLRERRVLLRGPSGETLRVEGRAAPATPSVAFMFAGQGEQRPGMAAALYDAEPVFRAALDECCEGFAPLLPVDLQELLLDPDADPAILRRTAATQPAMFAFTYAQATLWRSWGVEPAAMIGHSLGELVAATLADVFSLKDAIRMVAARGRLMDAQPEGAMLAVMLGEEVLRQRLTEGLEIAALNAPGLCVAAGRDDGIEALERSLTADGIGWRRLDTSHAFHTDMMQDAAAGFTGICRSISLHPPRLPFISNITGEWITDADATDPDYWGRHIREAVRFADGIGTLLGDAGRVLVEIGPGGAISGLARMHPATSGRLVVSSSGARQGDMTAQCAMIHAFSSLWAAGMPVDWSVLHDGVARRRVPLPSYPFERTRHWVERGTRLSDISRRAGPQQYDWSDAPAAAQLKALAALPGGTEVTISASDLLALTHSIALPEDAEPEQLSLTIPPPEAVEHAAPLPALDDRSEMEALIADVWREFLGVVDVGPEDDFFALGGHSLLAIQIIARLRAEFGVEIPAGAAYEAPTVRGMARVIDALLVADILAKGGEAAE